MTIRVKNPSALKHGGFAENPILGGEDPKQFEKLHRGLIREFAPCGASEDHIIANLARLMWRKEHLSSNRMRSRALEQIKSPGASLGRPYETPPAGVKGELLVAFEGAAAEIRMESTEGLIEQLAVEERLDASIDKLLKRLLFIRGLKSIAPAVYSKPQVDSEPLPR